MTVEFESQMARWYHDYSSLSVGVSEAVGYPSDSGNSQRMF